MNADCGRAACLDPEPGREFPCEELVPVDLLSLCLPWPLDVLVVGLSTTSSERAPSDEPTLPDSDSVPPNSARPSPRTNRFVELGRYTSWSGVLGSEAGGEPGLS
ncbi:hypothetical protein PLEOSDRAFT_1090056 [Pleurotus ostreatus PC15]|uniref:Uncharacterized protein n=1 Tax=Pleurotus ostreatus (strain PC15) TaxID=1137138 RepID=A0A067NPC8_PLEO1|nr:hypothetical protein PLEOSDRAFT_1090056 [Pleurotus ostreatus PC15]